MKRSVFTAVLAASFLLIGGAGQAWAIDWGECQQTEFSKLKPENVMPACSQMIETGKVSLEDLAIAHFRRGRGHYKERDFDRAIADYRSADNQGLVDAQFHLAVMTATGEGVAEDKAEAAKWFRRAANQGDSDAQYNLGLMYGDGEGVPMDLVQAHMWLSMAAAQGDADAAKNRDLAANLMTPEQIAEA